MPPKDSHCVAQMLKTSVAVAGYITLSYPCPSYDSRATVRSGRVKCQSVSRLPIQCPLDSSILAHGVKSKGESTEVLSSSFFDPASDHTREMKRPYHTAATP